jgi:hypothetical protein
MESPLADVKNLFPMRARCRAAELVAPEALAQADPAASIYRALGLGGRACRPTAISAARDPVEPPR